MAKRKTEEQHEREVARRHAELARQRQDELAQNPTRDLPGLVKQMKAMRDHLDALPTGLEYDLNAVEALDDCRGECFNLKATVEAILHELGAM
jgi:hypothetical protein